MRNSEGEQFGVHLKARIARELERLAHVLEQQKVIRAEQRDLEERCESERLDKIRRLKSLRGVGQIGGWNLVSELFGWRTFDNRKQVGASIGLSPTPYSSGDMQQE